MQSETINKIIPAVIAAMNEIESVDKNLEVGAGTKAAYKGVADKDVKLSVRKVMAKNGLMILTTNIDPEVTISEWDEDGQYGKKHKTQVFTKVLTTYRIFHTSGEWLDTMGYGHGVDSQDKSAGKATTYALKYALLNGYLIPTGDIDDTDVTHSENIPSKPAYAAKTVSKPQTSTGLHCDYHKVEMRLNKNGKPFHFVGDEFCNGMGTPSEKAAWATKVRTPVDETPIPVEPTDKDFEDSIGAQVAEEIPF